MVIGIFNNKGGVGKTTTVVNLAYEYTKKGKKVCVIDYDGQMNTTDFLLARSGNTKDGEKTMREIINEGTFNPLDFKLSRFVDVDLVTSSGDNNNLTDYFHEGEWGNFEEFCSRLITIKDILNKTYDVVIIDYPPTFNNVIKTLLAVMNDLTIVPVVLSDKRSIQALFNIVDFVSTQGINAEILINRFEDKATEKSTLEQMRESGLPIFDTVIPSTGYIKQADNDDKALTEKFRNINNDKIGVFERLATEIM